MHMRPRGPRRGNVQGSGSPLTLGGLHRRMRLLEAPEKLSQLQLAPVSRPAPRMQRSRHPCSVLSRAASSAATEPKTRIERSAGLNLKVWEQLKNLFGGVRAHLITFLLFPRGR